MATTQKASMAVDAAVTGFASGASTATALPGTPASDSYVRVTNIGSAPVFVKLGTTSAVSVTPQAGLCVMPGQTEFLTIGSNLYIAMVTSTQQGSQVNLATGN